MKAQEKIEESLKLNEKDASFAEDAVEVLINLASLEGHAINSFHKTNDNSQLELNDLCRKTRTILLNLLVSESGNQLWCETKHLASVIMGLRELGNRYYSFNQRESAKEFYNASGLFLGILLELNNIKNNN
jgi:hypothetical protein